MDKIGAAVSNGMPKSCWIHFTAGMKARDVSRGKGVFESRTLRYLANRFANCARYAKSVHNPKQHGKTSKHCYNVLLLEAR